MNMHKTELISIHKHSVALFSSIREVKEINTFSPSHFMSLFLENLQHSLPPISSFTVLARCCHCYREAQASFLLWRYCELGSFAKCSGLRERSSTSGSLPPSNKEQKKIEQVVFQVCSGSPESLLCYQ